MKIRTDLAIEGKEILEEENKGKKIEIKGVEVDEDQYDEGITVTRIKITNESGSKALGKPIGTYITIEVKDLVDGDEKERQLQQEHYLTNCQS